MPYNLETLLSRPLPWLYIKNTWETFKTTKSPQLHPHKYLIGLEWGSHISILEMLSR